MHYKGRENLPDVGSREQPLCEEHGVYVHRYCGVWFYWNGCGEVKWLVFDDQETVLRLDRWIEQGFEKWKKSLHGA